MSYRTLIFSAAISVAGAASVADAAEIQIQDGFARGGPKSGAAFFTIVNTGDIDDRLIGTRSDVASRVELHTHIEDTNGVMKMREIEGGLTVPAGASHALVRGGDHVMFMGLEKPFEDGGTINLTLTFEHAGDISVRLPVDNAR